MPVHQHRVLHVDTSPNSKVTMHNHNDKSNPKTSKTRATSHPIIMTPRGYYIYFLSLLLTIVQVVFSTLCEELFSMFKQEELNSMLVDDGVEWSNLIPNTPSYEKLSAAMDMPAKSPRARPSLNFSQHVLYEFKYPEGI
ncbi:hypothetical protein C9374_004450 [Naegleria lovaniensis]|uniref:Uncharacterized protein n=1 Tax=Naegleria lovaniensis TaxID=51637 RepID=A0AA88GS19_NAELO|nr:uncharacterized protein C9374_004450 [Naegleria lovaniensis]KAG2383113.1 hypothetical protein C9374_004450 [Naegleria lovaniensis]